MFNELLKPFNDQSWNALGRISESLINEHKINLKSIENHNYAKWAQEAFEIGESFVYEGTVEELILLFTFL